MAEKPIIYIKQTGEPYVPVTVRIEWLSCGKIIPLMYWTPDNSCYEIKHVYEMTPIAFLKERGEGIRFRVRAMVTDVPEPDSNFQNIQHETYLYLADKFFNGKNIIDGRYGHEAKEFIPVMLDVFPDCGYELIAFKAQGITYVVERTLAIEPRASFYAGGVGVWHKVSARQVNSDYEDMDSVIFLSRTSALYFELNKWFVCIKPA